ncbi:hypothetical protein [Kitasatospora sp. NPDC087271]|uniref:hypothetical protein n=1 Tax=Kitasatospora sp. NPDC087271 TaxID=3364067 RepID=UPI0038243AB7
MGRTFSLLPGAPNNPPIGRAIFTTDASNTLDQESDLSRNVWEFGFARASLGAPAPGNANLFFAAPHPSGCPASDQQAEGLARYRHAI